MDRPLCFHRLLRRSHVVCGCPRARKSSARQLRSNSFSSPLPLRQSLAQDCWCPDHSGRRVWVDGFSQNMARTSARPSRGNFGGRGRPSTIPAKCSAPATPTAGANNNELIKMLIHINKHSEMCWCLFDWSSQRREATYCVGSNPNQPEHPRWSRLRKPIIRKSSKLSRAIAMYEASARPPRRGSDRRASRGTANAWTGSHHNETRRSIVMAHHPIKNEWQQLEQRPEPSAKQNARCRWVILGRIPRPRTGAWCSLCLAASRSSSTT